LHPALGPSAGLHLCSSMRSLLHDDDKETGEFLDGFVDEVEGSVAEVRCIANLAGGSELRARS